MTKFMCRKFYTPIPNSRYCELARSPQFYVPEVED